MQKLLLFHFEACPYCREAYRLIDEIKREHAEFENLEIERIDEKEHPEIANAYDYWYVPTFFVGDKKLHEGACDKRAVLRVMRYALEA